VTDRRVECLPLFLAWNPRLPHVGPRTGVRGRLTRLHETIAREQDMATATTQYEPDYAVPPGWVLKDRLDAQGMKPAELARRCGRSAKLINEIIAGKAPIEPRTALQFEKVLGVDAEIWLGIETDYRLQRTREAEAELAAAAWARSFPVRELAKHVDLRESSRQGAGDPQCRVEDRVQDRGELSDDAASVRIPVPRPQGR